MLLVGLVGVGWGPISIGIERDGWMNEQNGQIYG